MKVVSNFSTTTIELDVREALEHIRQLSTAVNHALATGTGAFCNGCLSERSSLLDTHQTPGVVHVIVRQAQ